MSSGCNVLSDFESRYGSIRDDTVSAAAKDEPSILLRLLSAPIDDEEIAVVIRGLSFTQDEVYIDQVSAFLSSKSVTLREAAVTGLHMYAEDDEDLAEQRIFPLLRKHAASERSTLVMASIDAALRCNTWDFEI